MGISLHFVSTAPGDFRTWVARRLPPWWDAWVQASAELGLPIAPLASVGKADLDRLMETVNRLRPLTKEPWNRRGQPLYCAPDRPTRQVFQLARKFLLRGSWEMNQKGADRLVLQILRDTHYRLRFLPDPHYRLRYPDPGDRIDALLAPLSPARDIVSGYGTGWPPSPTARELPASTSPALRSLWSNLRYGRTIVVVPPADGAGEVPHDACTPNIDDHIYGWFDEGDCEILLRDLPAILDEPFLPLPPRPPARVLMNAGSGWVELPAAPPRKPDRSALARMLEIAKEARSLGGGMVFVPG